MKIFLLLVSTLFQMFPGALAQTSIDLDADPSFQTGGHNWGVGVDECGLDIGIGSFDLNLGGGSNCNSGVIPDGEFDLEGVREDYFLKLREFYTDVYPVCKTTESGDFILSGESVFDQTGGDYTYGIHPTNAPAAPLDPVMIVGNPIDLAPETFSANCQLDYGIAGAFSIRAFIVQLINWALTFLGLLAITAIIYAGFLYLFYYGDDSRTTTAKNIIRNAIIGIIIIFLAYALVNTVLRALMGFDNEYAGNDPANAGIGDTITTPLEVYDSGEYPVGNGYYILLSASSDVDGLQFRIPGVAEYSKLTYYWDDGTNLQLPNLQEPDTPITNTERGHRFTQNGIYTVRVLGRTTDGATVIAETRVYVGGVKAAPKAIPQQIIAGESLQLNGQNSYTPVGVIDKYSWNGCEVISGGPCPADLTGIPSSNIQPDPNLDIVFENPGEYKIYLGVGTTFSNGIFEGDSITVNVGSDQLFGRISKPLTRTLNASRPAEYILDATQTTNVYGTGTYGLTYTWTLYSEDDGVNPIDTIVTTQPRVNYDFETQGTYYAFLQVSQDFDGTTITSEEYDNGATVCDDGDDTDPTQPCATIVVASTIGIDFNTLNVYDVDETYSLRAVTSGGVDITDLTEIKWGVYDDYANAAAVADLGVPVLNELQGEVSLLLNQGPEASVVFTEQGGPIFLVVRGIDNEGQVGIAIKTVYARDAGQPVAAATLNINGDDQSISPIINEVFRTDVVTLSSGNSINVNGTLLSQNDRLDISWTLDGEPVYVSPGADPDEEISSQLEFNPNTPLGARAIKLIVTDEVQGSLRDEYQFTLNVINQPPEFTLGNEITTSLNILTNQLTVTANVTDPDTVDANNANGIIDQYVFEILENGVIIESQILTTNETIFDLSSYAGEHEYDVRVRVYDGDNAQAQFAEYDAASVFNEIVNNPPVVSAYAQSSFGNTDLPFKFLSSVTDPDGDAVDLMWDFDCTGVLPEDTVDTSNPSPSYRYQPMDGVDYPIEVTVCLTADDGISPPTVDQFTIILAEGDLPADGAIPPMVEITGVVPQTINASGGLSAPAGTNYSFTGLITDPNFDDEHEYQWTIPELGFDQVRLSPTLSLPFTDPGTYTVTLTATEKNTLQGYSGEASVTIEIIEIVPPLNGGNTQPSVSLRAELVVGGPFYAGYQTPIFAEATDGDFNQDLTYDWNVNNETFTTQAAFLNYVFDAPGTYTVTATVTDNSGQPNAQSDDATLDIIVIDNPQVTTEVPPVVQIIDVTPGTINGQGQFSRPEGTQYVFNALVQDQNITDVYAYRWEIDELGFDEIRANANLIYTFDTPGTYTVRMTATEQNTQNQYANSDEVTVVITEQMTNADLPNGGNTQPVVTLDETLAASTQPTNRFMTFSAYGFDSDFNQSLTYAWTVNGVSQSTTNSYLTTQFNDAGEHIISVTATDNSGESNDTSAPVDITITTADTATRNSAPVEPVVRIVGVSPARVNGDGVLTADAPAVYGFGGLITDPNFDDEYEYRWQIDGENFNQIRLQPNLSYTFEEPGTYTVRLVTTETNTDEAFTANDEVTVIITEPAVPTNTRPVVTLQQVTPGPPIQPGAPVTFYAAAFDPDPEQDLTYFWDMDGEEIETTSGTLTYSFIEDGAYDISVTAMDDSEAENDLSEPAEITVGIGQNVPNNPPQVVITSIVPTGIAVTSDWVQIHANAVDPDPYDVLTYTWEINPGGITRTTQGATLGYIFADAGEYDITLTVSDGTEEATDSVTYTVEESVIPGPADTAPQVAISSALPSLMNAVQPQGFGAAGDRFVFSGYVLDPDFNDDHVFEWDFGNGETRTTANPYTVYQYNTPGQYTLKLKATDLAGNEDTAEVLVTVVDPDDPRIDTLGVLPDEGVVITKVLPAPPRSTETLVQFYSLARPPVGQTMSYVWDMGDGTTYSSPNVTHLYTQPGTYTATLTGTATDGTTFTDSVPVEVAPGSGGGFMGGSGPQALITGAISGQGIRMGEPFSLRSFVSGLGEGLTYRWDMGDGVTYATDAITHTYESTGLNQILLEVTDAAGEVATYQLPINVVGPNGEISPAPTGGIGQVIPGTDVPAGAPFMAFGNGSAAGGELSYTWDMGDGTTYTTDGVNHVYATPGTYTMTMTGSDGDMTFTDTRTITVRPDPTQQNRPPVANITAISPGQTGAVGGVFGFYSYASDPDGDEMTYEWDMGDGTFYTQNTAAHAYDSTGTYTVTLTVSDGNGATTDSRTVNVVEASQVPNTPPGVSIGSVTPGQQGSITTNFMLSSFVSQMDFGRLIYDWDMGDGTRYDTPTVIHQYRDSGTYAVSVTVSDGIETDTASTTLTVQNAAGLGNLTANIIGENIPPTVEITNVTPGTVGTTETLFAFYSTGSDANGDEVDYTWKFPGGIRYTVPAVWHRFLIPGTYTVEIEANDGLATTVDTVEISILDADGNVVPFDPSQPNLPEGQGPLGDISAVAGAGGDAQLNPDLAEINALDTERSDLLRQLELITDPVKRAQLQKRVAELTAKITDISGNAANDVDQKALTQGLIAGYIAQREADKVRLMEAIEAETDPDKRAILQAKLDEVITELALLARDPSAALGSMGISLQHGVIPYPMVTSGRDGRFFLYGTSPADSARALYFLWDLGDGRVSTGQNAVVSYANPGYYRVAFSVTDGVSTASDILIIRVKDE